MAEKRPICIYNGELEELKTTDTLPSSGGSVDWTVDQGATNIHDNNVPHTSITSGNPHGVTKTDLGITNNETIDHSIISISSGEGITGGGDLTTSRSLSLDLNSLTEDLTPDGASDYVATYDASGTSHKKVKLNNLPSGGGGEINTASNIGSSGLGVFKQKTGTNLEFKNINTGSSKLTLSDDTVNNEIDIDIDEGAINHNSLLNYSSNEHIDWTISQGTPIHANNIPEKSPFINSVSVSRSLTSNDKNAILECTGNITITLPDGLNTGFQCVIVNVGTGTITISASTTLNAKATLLESQWGGCTVYHRGSNAWVAMGDLT